MQFSTANIIDETTGHDESVEFYSYVVMAELLKGELLMASY